MDSEMDRTGAFGKILWCTVYLLIFVHVTRSEHVWLERNSDTQTVNQPLSH